ncbi:MAG: hypothetical protein NVS2B12_05900 [Ktedonobacteraceae bacterium]
MGQILNPATDASWRDADILISILRAWGIEYLVGLAQAPSPPHIQQLAPVELIKRLAQQNENARIRDASISLFLLHPELTDAILEAIKVSEPGIAEQIITSTLATLYLQRKWSIRLALALGHPSDLPEQPFAQCWQQRHLPSPAPHNGEWGLLALQTFEQRRTGMPFSFIGDWQNQLDHLLWQEETRHRARAVSLPPQLFAQPVVDDQEFDMSMRPSVDKKAIESFLQQLGRTFRKAGRLYLVGGAALVHAGVRPGFTQDIDIQVGGANEGDLIISIQRLIQQMQINIEFASPQDFIPLPTQWEANAQYIGRYGQIEVFYFDFYSIALSKIERATTRDIEDVKLLVQQKRIALDELDTSYQEVLAQLGKGHYPKITPERFAERYAAIRALL